ncbi:MAG: transposase [Gaiellaceae bacterium]
MTRPPRDRGPGPHHVVVGATGREAYFRDELDRTVWIRDLVRVTRQLGWSCVAFAQLTTHVHVLLDVPDESLPAGMHRLNTGYGKHFNERHERAGYLRRARYWSKPKRTGSELLSAYLYVARNPVVAGLCRSPADWTWSSIATTCGLAEAYPWVDATSVLELLPADERPPRLTLLDIVCSD